MGHLDYFKNPKDYLVQRIQSHIWTPSGREAWDIGSAILIQSFPVFSPICVHGCHIPSRPESLCIFNPGWVSLYRRGIPELSLIIFTCSAVFPKHVLTSWDLCDGWSETTLPPPLPLIYRRRYLSRETEAWPCFIQEPYAEGFTGSGMLSRISRVEYRFWVI